MRSFSDLGWDEKIDILALAGKDIHEMDTPCTLDEVHKFYYFSDSFAPIFLSKPSAKFTIKSDLNDPFDLSRRWSKFSAECSLDYMSKIVARDIQNKLKDENYVLQAISGKPQFMASGMSLGQLRLILASPIGRAAIENMRSSIEEQIPAFIDAVFGEANKEIDAQVEDMIRETGIFSLTENLTNRAMWSLYAGSGNGFALTFDASHSFFDARTAAPPRRSRLKKVAYTDQRWEDFWQNPYALFAVKNEEYSFEKEWRMLRDISECEKVSLENGPIYTLPMPKGFIKRISFGYSVKKDDALRLLDILRGYDADVLGQIAFADAASGELRFQGLR